MNSFQNYKKYKLKDVLSGGDTDDKTNTSINHKCSSCFNIGKFKTFDKSYCFECKRNNSVIFDNLCYKCDANSVCESCIEIKYNLETFKTNEVNEFSSVMNYIWLSFSVEKNAKTIFPNNYLSNIENRLIHNSNFNNVNEIHIWIISDHYSLNLIKQTQKELTTISKKLILKNLLSLENFKTIYHQYIKYCNFYFQIDFIKLFIMKEFQESNFLKNKSPIRILKTNIQQDKNDIVKDCKIIKNIVKCHTKMLLLYLLKNQVFRTIYHSKISDDFALNVSFIKQIREFTSISRTPSLILSGNDNDNDNVIYKSMEKNFDYTIFIYLDTNVFIPSNNYLFTKDTLSHIDNEIVLRYSIVDIF